MKQIVKQKKYLPITIIIFLIIIVSGAFILRFTDSTFRYNFDIIFNCQEQHTSYYTNASGETEKLSIPLPPSTTLAFRHSNTAVTYYSKIQYEDFLDFYSQEGFTVVGNIVSTNGISFEISNTSEKLNSEYKYYFIDIDLISDF